MDSGQDNKIIVGDMRPHRLKAFLKKFPKPPKNKKTLLIAGLLLVSLVVVGIVVYKNQPVKDKPVTGSTSDQINANVGYEQLTKKPKDADSALLVGDLYYSRNMFSDARKAYREAIKFETGNAEAYASIALSYEREGNKEQAKANYQKAADIYKFRSDVDQEANMFFAIKELDQNYENVINEE